MKRFLLTLVCFSLFAAAPVSASEEFDPALFPEDYDSVSTAPVSGHSMIAAPKFVSDEDMNFDDLVDSETSGTESEEIPLEEPTAMPVSTPLPQAAAPAPPPPSAIPMIQQSNEKEESAEEKATEEAPKISKNQTLTDTLTDGGSKEEIKIPGVDTAGTWINKLKSTAVSTAEEKKAASAEPGLSLEGMVQKSKKAKKRSNASVFDISGAMLRMTFKQIDEVLARNGYKRTVQKFDIPNFIRWRNEDKCRASGVVGYERLANCVVKIAKQNKHEYIETASYAKFDTQENIEIRFTSNFTNNKAYKISYKSEAVNIGGNSPKMMYLRNIKIYDFWKKINQKYGAPDNKDDVMWGLGGNKPYMQAGTGRLILEDPMLRELDYTRMSREDQRFMNTDLYSF